MSTVDRDALIEQAAVPIFRDIVRSQGYDPDDPEEMSDWSESDLGYMQTDSRIHATLALPVIAKALLAPLRELHHEREVGPLAGYCVMDGCVHPCPTVRLLDAIDADVQP